MSSVFSQFVKKHKIKINVNNHVRSRPLYRIVKKLKELKYLNLQPEPVIVHYILQLPVEITRSIFNEYLKKVYNHKYALLQTTEKFNQLRKQIIYLNVDEQRFYLKREFRERVLSCIENPHYQLHLVFRCNSMRGWPESIDLSVVLPVHQLSIHSCSTIDNFHLIGTYKPNVLDISDCRRSIDIEVCKGISTLRLSYCYKIENIDKFSDIKVFKLRSCVINPADWSIFSSLQVFELVDCKSLTDVSSLAHIRDLTLYNCSNVTNIDSLTHNDNLSIFHCGGISNISLSDYPRNKVCIGCTCGLIGMTIAGKVKNLQLDFLPYLSQISLLDEVNKLVIKRTEDLVSLNYLPVHSLSLILCTNIEEISSSLPVKSLEIKECDSITSIRSLQYLESLVVDSANDLESIEDLPLLRSLDIDYCENLTRLINLPLCTYYNRHFFFDELEVVNCPGYVKPNLIDF